MALVPTATRGGAVTGRPCSRSIPHASHGTTEGETRVPTRDEAEAPLAGIPLPRAEEVDLLALPAEVEAEIVGVPGRLRLAAAVSEARRARILDLPWGRAVWFGPSVRVTDRRDAKGDEHLELALTPRAGAIASADEDLLVPHPSGAACASCGPRPAAYLAMVGPGPTG